MFVKKGNQLPTPEDYDYISEELMLNGLAVLIEGKNGTIINSSP